MNTIVLSALFFVIVDFRNLPGPTPTGPSQPFFRTKRGLGILLLCNFFLSFGLQTQTIFDHQGENGTLGDRGPNSLSS